MAALKEMFDDPRARPRGNTNDRKPRPFGIEKLPKAEEDWYLKRKPIVSYILDSKITIKNITTPT